MAKRRKGIAHFLALGRELLPSGRETFVLAVLVWERTSNIEKEKAGGRKFFVGTHPYRPLPFRRIRTSKEGTAFSNPLEKKKGKKQTS